MPKAPTPDQEFRRDASAFLGSQALGLSERDRHALSKPGLAQVLWLRFRSQHPQHAHRYKDFQEHQQEWILDPRRQMQVDGVPLRARSPREIRREADFERRRRRILEDANAQAIISGFQDAAQKEAEAQEDPVEHRRRRTRNWWHTHFHNPAEPRGAKDADAESKEARRQASRYWKEMQGLFRSTAPHVPGVTLLGRLVLRIPAIAPALFWGIVVMSILGFSYLLAQPRNGVTQYGGHAVLALSLGIYNVVALFLNNVVNAVTGLIGLSIQAFAAVAQGLWNQIFQPLVELVNRVAGVVGIDDRVASVELDYEGIDGRRYVVLNYLIPGNLSACPDAGLTATVDCGARYLHTPLLDPERELLRLTRPEASANPLDILAEGTFDGATSLLDGLQSGYDATSAWILEQIRGGTS